MIKDLFDVVSVIEKLRKDPETNKELERMCLRPLWKHKNKEGREKK